MALLPQVIQLAAAFVISFAFLLLHVTKRPYVSAEEDRLQAPNANFPPVSTLHIVDVVSLPGLVNGGHDINNLLWDPLENTE